MNAQSSTGAKPHAVVLARKLLSAGHEVRVVCVESSPDAYGDLPGRRVTCRRDDEQADLPFDAPCLVVPGIHTDPPPTPPWQGGELLFSHRQATELLFSQLSDAQLAAYREAMRRALDEEVASFDPQVIHCQHAWVGSHLALETGVPYLLNAHAEELAAQETDSRYRRLVGESMENAGRILVSTPALRREVLAMRSEIENRVLLVDEPIELRQLIAALPASDRRANVVKGRAVRGRESFSANDFPDRLAGWPKKTPDPLAAAANTSRSPRLY